MALATPSDEVANLPVLLLVDDSESVLAFERAALSKDYQTQSATNGLEALAMAAKLRPALILLDLSMPQLDGDEVLRRVRADADLGDTPVVIVSSERDRANACLQLGADAVLHKPVKAETLRKTVDEVLSRKRRSELQGSMAVLPARVGSSWFALPVPVVMSVHAQPETSASHSPQPSLASMVEVGLHFVPVLDLASLLGVAYSAPLEDRKLVIVDVKLSGPALALCVDEVLPPEEIPPNLVSPAVRLAEPSVLAVVKSAARPLAVVNVAVLLSERSFDKLAALLDSVTRGAGVSEQARE